MNEMEQAYLEYQAEYVKRQNQVARNLIDMADETKNHTYAAQLLDAAEFILEEHC